jgi:hypothetical protein
MELGNRPHELPGRSIHRNSEALECTGLCCIGERKAHVLLRPRLAGELTAAVARNSFIGVAGQQLIQLAAEIGVAIVTDAIKRRRAASEAAKALRDDMFNPAESSRVRLWAIDTLPFPRHAFDIPLRHAGIYRLARTAAAGGTAKIVRRPTDFTSRAP